MCVEVLAGLVLWDSLGLREGREQCWSSQDRVVRHSSSMVAVDTTAL